MELNTLKMVEMAVDFRKSPAPPAPITLCDYPVDTLDYFSVLGTIIIQDFKWELKLSSLTKKTQQRMYFLWRVKKFNLLETLLHRCHRIHSQLLHHCLVRCCCSQGQGQTAAYHSLCWECDWPQSAIPPGPVCLQDREAIRIKTVADPSHARHKHFETPPSGRRLWSIRAKNLTSQEQLASSTSLETP